jgi:hypothetical protein
MKKIDAAMQRLLRSAAQVPDEQPAAVPFGFETRVIALWRAGNKNGAMNGIARLAGRVLALAAVVILIFSAASVYEFRDARDAIESGSDEFAIADSAIDTEFYQ